MNRYILVMIGAAVGGLARYILGAAIMRRFPGPFPLGTLAVNVTGCFLIGVSMTYLTERLASNLNLRLLVVTGVLGGYTTYSSFAWETYQSVRDASPWLGLVNIVASVTLGYMAVWFGALLVKR